MREDFVYDPKVILNEFLYLNFSDREFIRTFISQISWEEMTIPHVDTIRVCLGMAIKYGELSLEKVFNNCQEYISPATLLTIYLTYLSKILGSKVCDLKYKFTGFEINNLRVQYIRLIEIFKGEKDKTLHPQGEIDCIIQDFLRKGSVIELMSHFFSSFTLLE